MPFLYLLEALSALLFVLIMISQVAIPVWRGRPLFPYLRRRNLYHDVLEAQEIVDQEELRQLRERIEKGEIK